MAPSPEDAALALPVLDALSAVADGTATPEQHQLAAGFSAAIKHPSVHVVGVLESAIGPLASVMEAPWHELNEIQRWLRTQSAAADEARNSPSLSDMSTVYDLLVAAGSYSGPRIKLSPGANIIALDENKRRFLIPHVVDSVLDRIRQAESTAAARRVANRPGSVRFHWSSRPTGLVPDPRELSEELPIKPDGSYLMLYAASVDVVGKRGFLDATTTLVRTLPFVDVLVWDATAPPAVLWSLLGMFGHRAGDDVDIPEHLADGARAIHDALLDL